MHRVQICDELNPGALLHLSLTCKWLHYVLSSDSSKEVWSNSRTRSFLPDIEGLTEMQYATIVWDTTDCNVSKEFDLSSSVILTPKFLYRIVDVWI